MAQAVKNPPSMQETQEVWVQSLGRKDALEEEMVAHSNILAWENCTNRGAWQATVHGVTKSWRCQNTQAHQPEPPHRPSRRPPCQLPHRNLRLDTSGEAETLGHQENGSQLSFSTMNAPPRKHVFKIKEVLPSPTVPPCPFYF